MRQVLQAISKANAFLSQGFPARWLARCMRVGSEAAYVQQFSQLHLDAYRQQISAGSGGSSRQLEFSITAIYPMQTLSHPAHPGWTVLDPYAALNCFGLSFLPNPCGAAAAAVLQSAARWSRQFFDSVCTSVR